MKKLVLITISVLVIAGMCISGCAPKAPDESLPPVKVGIMKDLTGVHAEAGRAQRNGIKLALDEANDDGGINGRKLIGGCVAAANVE